MTSSAPVPGAIPAGYAQVRRNIAELVLAHPFDLGRIVPACPEWTVAGVVTHLAEIAESALARRGVDTPPATSKCLDAVLDRWEDIGARIDHALETDPDPRAVIMLMDAFTHELDLRAALGVEPPVGHPAQRPAFALLVRGFSARVTELGLPALRIRATGGQAWTAGSGPATATVAANPHVLYRSLAGRRTHEQLAGLLWSADPEPWLPAFTWGPFTPPPEPIE